MSIDQFKICHYKICTVQWENDVVLSVQTDNCVLAKVPFFSLTVLKAANRQTSVCFHLFFF